MLNHVMVLFGHNYAIKKLFTNYQHWNNFYMLLQILNVSLRPQSFLFHYEIGDSI